MKKEYEISVDGKKGHGWRLRGFRKECAKSTTYIDTAL